MNLSFRNTQIPPEEKPFHIVLASQSIGRKMLLEKLGIIFRTVVTNVDEEAIIDKDPIKMIQKRAAAKADEIIKNPRIYMLPAEGRTLIICADSMAVLGSKTYGKSIDKDQTKTMLKDLMGKTHVFVTAVKVISLLNGKVVKQWTGVEKTKVSMRKMTGPETDSYVTRYDFTRFAAGYALNEMPWDLVTKVDGSYTNVIGLPFEQLLPILRKLEIIV